KDVNGLQAGGNVWYSGVKVGTIDRVEFATGGVQVFMNVDEKAQPYIKKDTKAKVGSDGLIGNKIIVLYGGGPASPVVADGDLLASESLISIDDMMQTFQQNNDNLLEITKNLKNVSQGLADGKGSIGKLLNDESLTRNLDVALLSLQRSLNTTETVTKDVADYAAKLQKKGSLTNDLISDTVIFGRLRASVAQLQNISLTAQEVVNSVQATTKNVAAGLNDTNTPAGMLLNDKQTAENLKAVIQNLQTSTKKLDENMEALQSNFLFRGFFKKKNKNL
ncbi:MAG: MlaD family protein, partial [Bacteroidota bacterium]